MITIKTERVVQGVPVQMRKILEINGCLSEMELPRAYLQGSPCIYKDPYKNQLILKFGHDLLGGDVMDESMFQKSIDIIRRACKRLHDMNHSDQVKELQKTWNGKEEFTF